MYIKNLKLKMLHMFVYVCCTLLHIPVHVQYVQHTYTNMCSNLSFTCKNSSILKDLCSNIHTGTMILHSNIISTLMDLSTLRKLNGAKLSDNFEKCMI